MLTVGVCEDDPAIRKVLTRALSHAGHQAVVAFNGAEAVRLFSDRDLDAIVMDIGLPDADGRDVVQALQSAGQHAPVLVLTALGELHDRLSGFASGADDYVVKPFDVPEVLARIEVLARRSRTPRPERADQLRLDPVTHSAQTVTGTVQLTPTEYRVLAAITSRPGAVVRRREVVNAGWPDGAYVAENSLDTHLRRIRTKLESIDSPVSITTVRGVGYRLA